MQDFPEFMKDPARRVDAAQQNTADAQGYVYGGASGQMAFWTCGQARESGKHTHPFDEWMAVIAGEYTVCTAAGEVCLRPGDETVVPAGVEQWGRCIAGTRTVHAFGGPRVKQAAPVCIEHAAIWTSQLEVMQAFYVRWFGGVPAKKYTAKRANGAVFESVFLSFGGGARLELMRMNGVPDGAMQPALGMAHIAFGVPGEAAVDEMAERISAGGFALLGAPRRTGDGYYEAVIADPDGNRVEIAAV